MSIKELDLGSKMIIFELILTTFDANLEAAETVAKIGPSLKLNHHRQI